jgi:hypothetical protein
MSAPSQPTLTDALLKDALNRRAAGPHGAGELVDDVLIAVRSTTQGRSWSLQLAPDGRPLVVLITAALLLIAIAAGALAGAQLRRDPEAILTQSGVVEPFLGLPPAGAAPSTPEVGRLIFEDWGIHPWFSVNVYADGRMIWAQESGPLADGPNGSTGWIEQRLTPQGVELVRTGAVELGGQHEDPGQRLPASAWSDTTIRGYVPAAFSVCYWYLDDYETDPAKALTAFPAEAQTLLTKARKTYYIYSDGNGRPGDLHCHDLATADALKLNEILTGAGAERGVGFNSVDYALDDGIDRAGLPLDVGYGIHEGTPFVYVAPLLPHGQAIGAGG